jgi:hypothetical protein
VVNLIPSHPVPHRRSWIETSAARRSGAALLEAMVALGLLAGAIASLAGLYGVAARSNSEARRATRMSIAAAQKMEQLRGLSWAVAEDNEDATDLSTDLSTLQESAGGPGLRPSPPGTLTSDVAGYVDYLDEHGLWVGAGSGPPAGAVFTRRWSVDPLAESPLDTLVFRVVVVRTAAARSGPPAEGRDGAIALTTVRSRRSR